MECDAKDASKLIRFFKHVFPSTLEAKNKIGNNLTLGYSCNFVPLFSNGKAIKSTPDVLQRLIDSQKHILKLIIWMDPFYAMKTDQSSHFANV